MKITINEKSKRAEEIKDLIEYFFKRHPLAKELGGEYIAQNDDSRVDAIDLVSAIADLYSENY